MEEVIPAAMLPHLQTKASQGEDWVKLPNNSIVHFVGLDDPVRWFSSELGLVVFDEAHEIAEDDALKLITRLRQRCKNCRLKPVFGADGSVVACEHMPNKVILAFNPENPGHWIYRWLMTDGAQKTDFGFWKDELYTEGADEPLGSAEFVFANADDNPFLSNAYRTNTLGALKPLDRRRYKDGEWLYTSGTCYFDLEALERYRERLETPILVGRTKGDPTGKSSDRCGVQAGKTGPLAVWKTPVRERDGERGKRLPAHRYIVTVDVSSGGAQDYSGIQVLDVEEFGQVARFQGKMDPDLVAVEAVRLARIYNEALIAPEITGGWGFSVVREIQRLGYRKLHTRRVMDRLTDKWTDRVGWDTTAKTRAYMLDTLERVIREEEFVLRDDSTFNELLTFVRDENDRPAAQPGCHDDLCVSLAIGVTLASQMPREITKPRPERHQPTYAATGW